MNTKNKFRRPLGYWNVETVIQEINNRYTNNLSLSVSDVQKEDAGLFDAARKYFGSWGEAIEKAGFDYKAIRKKNSWDKNKIIQTLKSRYEKGLPISSLALQQEDKALYSAIIKHFGSLEKAIEYCGYNYKDIKKYKNKWTKEKVKKELIRRKEKGLSLNSLDVKKENIALHNACIRYFGTYKAAIESCGWDYNEIQTKQKWSKEKIIKELQKRGEQGLGLNANAIAFDNQGLYVACIRYFNDFENAINEAGFNYEDIREDTYSLQYLGREFEIFLSKIFNELKISYSRKFTGEIRPDFIFSHNRWGDAKLSENTIFGCDTIQKYEPHCKMLTIIFLRGNKNTDIMITKKTRLISVYNLIKQLPKTIRKRYLLQANNLWERANSIETNGDSNE